MEFDWSTFVLEIINFLILVWILGRFLYRPVAEVIERRRVSIDSRLQRAHDIQAQAEAMQQQYETRLGDWDTEKRQLRENWATELTEEKARQMDAFRQTLEAERQQTEILEQRRLRSREAELEQHALDLGGRFAARLLERVASPELEARLADLFIEDLSGVPEEQWEMVAAAFPQGSGEATLTSAFPLAERQRADLQQAVSAQLGKPIECRFVEDQALIAGIRFELGPLSLSANIRDELVFFRRPT